MTLTFGTHLTPLAHLVECFDLLLDPAAIVSKNKVTLAFDQI